MPGEEQAARIVLKMLQEFLKRYDGEDAKIMAEAGYEYCRLALKGKSRTKQDNLNFDSVKNTFQHIVNKIELSLINEAKSYESLDKIIEVLKG